MGKVVEMNHPLILHKLSIIRKKETSTKDFKQLVNEIAMLMAYEVTKDFELQDVEEIVFSSECGEFTRLDNLIKQYQEFGETSPATFSTSVHNYPVSFFTLYNKLNLPYCALSAGKSSLGAGLVKSLQKRTLFTYADIYDGVKSVSCIISPNKSGLEFSGGSYVNESFENFIAFLKEDKKEFLTEFGKFFYV